MSERERCINDTNGDGDCHRCARIAGGCPFAALRAQVEAEKLRLREVVKSVEWSGFIENPEESFGYDYSYQEHIVDRCPVCEAPKYTNEGLGHAPDCQLAAVLRETEGS